jgi:hypothetical protein
MKLLTIQDKPAFRAASASGSMTLIGVPAANRVVLAKDTRKSRFVPITFHIAEMQRTHRLGHIEHRVTSSSGRASMQHRLA